MKLTKSLKKKRKMLFSGQHRQEWARKWGYGRTSHVPTHRYEDMYQRCYTVKNVEVKKRSSPLSIDSAYLSKNLKKKKRHHKSMSNDNSPQFCDITQQWSLSWTSLVQTCHSPSPTCNIHCISVFTISAKKRRSSWICPQKLNHKNFSHISLSKITLLFQFLIMPG